MATIAVRNLSAAKTFYEGTLGLKPTARQQPGTLSYESGSGPVLVYESQFAGTNKATSATWMVGGDLETIVRDLQSKGVTFEQYDLPGLTYKDGVHVSPGGSVAWLKDPDGNILALVSG